MEDLVKQFAQEIEGVVNNRQKVVPLLQKTQRHFGYISKQAIEIISHLLGLSEDEIYGIANFYARFRFFPPARHIIKICHGTACHVGGSRDILNVINKHPNIQGKFFEVQEVTCLGCCVHAPVVMIDDEFYTKITPEKIKQILLNYD